MKKLTYFLLIILTTPSYTQFAPELVKDISTIKSEDYFRASSIMPFGENMVVLRKGDLWFRNHTDKTITRLTNGNIFTSFINDNHYVEADGKLFLSVEHPAYGRELWVTDGTPAGTHLVKDIYPGCTESAPVELTAFNNKVYFFARIPGWKSNLYVTDGTEAGTMVADTSIHIRHDNVSQIHRHDSVLYITGYHSGTLNATIWISDGKPNGSHIFRSGIVHPGDMVSYKGYVYYIEMSNSFNHLHKIKGDSLLNIKELEDPLFLVTAGDYIFLTADSENEGRELWVSDGTPEGTKMVKDLSPLGYSSNPYGLIEMNDILYFSAYYSAGTSGVRHLFRSDGTTDGTYVVKNDPKHGYNPEYITTNGNLLFYRANDITNGTELWMSDGTEVGTKMAVEISAGEFSSDPSSMALTDDGLYFNAANVANDYNHELYFAIISNDTITTSVVKPATEFNSPSTPRTLSSSNDKLFFTAYGDSTFQFYSLSESGQPVPLVQKNIIFNIVSDQDVNGTVLFTNRDQENGSEVWKTDGTPEGTSLLIDIDKGPDDSNPSDFTKSGDQIFFFANSGNPIDTIKLFVSDGTINGTKKLADIDYTYERDERMYIADTIDGSIFIYHYYSGRMDIWYSDGTIDGTSIIYSNMNTYGEFHHCTYNGKFYFTNNATLTASSEIWVSDGTPTGTHKLYNRNDVDFIIPESLYATADFLYFQAVDTTTNTKNLWRTKGDMASILKLTTSLNHGLYTSATYLGAIDNKLLFVASDSIHGKELWISEGTPESTFMLKDINTGSGCSFYTHHANGNWFSDFSSVKHNGFLYFAADDGNTGIELWKTDGTESGTEMVADVWKGQPGAGVSQLKVVGNTLFFRARDEDHEKELWRLQLPTGIEEKEGLPRFTLYPNPSKGAFNIFSESKIEEVAVLDVLGKVVYQESLINSNNISVSLSGTISKGVYFVKVSTDRGTSTRQVVLQ